MENLLTKKESRNISVLRADLVSRKLLNPPNGFHKPYLGIFRFKTEEKINFIPGQYIALGISRDGLFNELSYKAKEKKVVKIINGKETIIKPYSIASTPKDHEIELYVAWINNCGQRLDSKGILTTELFDPKKETEYFFLSNKAKGNLYPPNNSKDVIMVSTKDGITPFRSITKFRSIARNNPEKDDLRKYILINGVSYFADLAYKEELENLQKVSEKSGNPWFEYFYSISKEESQTKKYVEEFFFNRDSDYVKYLISNGKSQRLTEEEIKEGLTEGKTNNTKIEEILGKELNPDNSVILLCGNDGTIKNMSLIAESKGYKSGVDLITESW